MKVSDLMGKMKAVYHPRFTDEQWREVAVEYNEALKHVTPQNLERAWDRVRSECKYFPKPAEILKFVSQSEPVKSGEVNRKKMFEYVKARQWELIDDWKNRNPELVQEGQRDGWWHHLLYDASRRAHQLAQHEYLMQNHGAWGHCGQDTIQFDEIKDPSGTAQLFFGKRIDGYRTAA